MKRDEVSLVIDVFTPLTLPMNRLAEYLKPFALLLGNEAHVHFQGVKEGSANCLALIEPHAAPKVKERLDHVVSKTAPRVAMKAHQDIDNLLLEDNALGYVALDGRNVIEFPGRMRAAQETIGPVRRSTSIEGQIYMIGGKDDTINVYLNEGHRETKCVVSVDLARRLGPHLRGPRIRFFGHGIWYRVDGSWEMKTFAAEDFLALDEKPLPETLKNIQANYSDVEPTEFMAAMQELREG